MSTVTESAVLFKLSSEFSFANGGGIHIAPDAGDYVVNEIPDDTTVLISNGYASSRFPIEHIEAYRASSQNEDRIRMAVEESRGPVYLVYPCLS